MNKFCTCGAPLPEDARFCHRCGKTQRDDDLPAEYQAPAVATVAATPPPLPAVSPQISFNNPLAVRTSIMVASFTSALELFPLGPLCVPVLAGFLTVWIYRRRSGLALTQAEGLKLGWFTAIFNGILLTLFVTLWFSLTNPDVSAFREQLKRQAFSPEQMRMVNEPWYLAFLALFIWVVVFALSSALHMAGGALGAKFGRQKASS